uniref:Uncharacterized protein n=1 Tax=Avena sativa TaxID=4498 RepID=A0ACD5UJG1_AVESA
MVDAVGGIAKIVGAALKIKEAVNTVHQNKKDCHHIKCRVDVLNRTLSQHENNADLMEDPAVMAALEALGGILAEALEVITKCQEERNIVCVHCAAGKLSRQLSKVEQRMSYLSSDAMFTIMNHQLLLKYQERAAPHPPPQVPKFGEWDVVNTDQAESYHMVFEKVREEHNSGMAAPPRPSPCSTCSSTKVSGQPLSLVKRISEVARNIKEAVKTVFQNRDGCVEIAKLVHKVGILLPQLQDTKMADKPAMRDALGKLLVTFHRAHALITACQRRGFAIVWFSTPPGRLSRQLHEVMDQIASNMADMTAILLS